MTTYNSYSPDARMWLVFVGHSKMHAWIVLMLDLLLLGSARAYKLHDCIFLYESWTSDPKSYVSQWA